MLAIYRSELLLLREWQVCKDKDLGSWHLYLVNWGYNTGSERDRAQTNERIAVVDMPQLQQACSI